jgi:Glycosyl transferases group 1
MNRVVIFLCTEHELDRERRGYFKAFSNQISTICIPALESDDYYELEKLIPDNVNPILLLHPDAYPRRLPHGLAASKIPTACFLIDTYARAKSGDKFSMLFDYAFVFHPGFDLRLHKAGHPKAICLPHAIEASLFKGKELEQIYDVGWVGRLDGKYYSVRRRCIEKLNSSFKMNDINRHYTPEEMAIVYQQSKIVVNLSRDDYLQDANLRCFEVMASGALLITHKPTELAQIGFIEGVHYVTYQRESDINKIVRFYLDNEASRQAITSAARNFVLNEHTYDSRVQTILNSLKQDDGKLFAPARQWDAAQVQSIYVQYFASAHLVETALQELHILRKLSQQMFWKMMPSVIKAFLVRLKMLL